MATPAPSRRGAKKVRPPPKHGITDEVLEDTWNKLAHAIQQIQRKNVSKLSFEEHYRYGYNLCLHRKHKKVYDGVADLVINHLETEAKDRIEPAFPTSTLLTATTSVASVYGSSAPVAGSSRGHVNGASTSEQRLIADSMSAGAGLGQGRMAQAMEGETFLGAMTSAWQDHKIGMGKIRDVLKYLDKTYTQPENKAPVYTLGLHLFLVHLIRHPTIQIQQNLLNVTLAMIRIERDGEIVGRNLLRTVIDMMCELREVSNDDRKGQGEPIYKSWWEDKFLDSSRDYYTVEAETNLERLSAPEYLERVEKRLQEEEDRVRQYLHASTEPLLFSLLDHVLIAQNVQAVVDHPNAGLHTLLTENRYADLARMYRIFGRVGDGHSIMRKGIKTWLVSQGQKIVEGLGSGQSSVKAGEEGPEGEEVTNQPSTAAKGKGKARETAESAQAPAGTAAAGPAAAGSAARGVLLALEWVNTVLALKDSMDKMLEQSFEGDRLFHNAINDAFVSFINQVKKAPEYISIYLDDNLKKGLKGKNESEVDDILAKTVTLFRYLDSKDVFEDYYKRHLAKRLLSDRSVSDDAERGMLQKLKLECGAQFVQKLEGMLKDVASSEDLNKGYRQYLERLGSERTTNTDLTVKVCTASYWPSHADVTCNLPPDFVKIAKSFERFFNTIHTGRRLTWHAEHGSVDVRVRFDKGPKDLNVATHGFVVLMAFEKTDRGESLSYEHLAAVTGLSEANLKRSLQSLACAKFKILKKDPPTRNINATDIFTFNHAFAAPIMKIKIATIANRVENTEETKETDTRLEAERSQLIDAAIVRTMKNRKQLSHGDLINEVTTQLSRRFTPKVIMMKLAVERLIEKEYLERDSTDKKLLRYMA